MVHVVPDCGFSRSYVISEDMGLMVVDIGSIGAAEDIEKFISEHPDLSMKDVRFITATHYHIDHIGGMGHFLKKCPPSTKVLFSPLVGEYYRKKRKLSLIRKWFSVFLPDALSCARYIKSFKHLCFESLSGIPLPGIRSHMLLPWPERRMGYFELNIHSPFGSEEGNRRSLNTCKAGLGGWEVIEAPGHTEDSLCFYHRDTSELICGDLVLNLLNNGKGKLNSFCWNWEMTNSTYQALNEVFIPKVIYPGHGEILRHPLNALSGVQIPDPL